MFKPVNMIGGNVAIDTRCDICILCDAPVDVCDYCDGIMDTCNYHMDV